MTTAAKNPTKMRALGELRDLSEEDWASHMQALGEHCTSLWGRELLEERVKHLAVSRTLTRDTDVTGQLQGVANDTQTAVSGTMDSAKSDTVQQADTYKDSGKSSDDFDTWANGMRGIETQTENSTHDQLHESFNRMIEMGRNNPDARDQISTAGKSLGLNVQNVIQVLSGQIPPIIQSIVTIVADVIGSVGQLFAPVMSVVGLIASIF